MSSILGLLLNVLIVVGLFSPPSAMQASHPSNDVAHAVVVLGNIQVVGGQTRPSKCSASQEGPCIDDLANAYAKGKLIVASVPVPMNPQDAWFSMSVQLVDDMQKWELCLPESGCASIACGNQKSPIGGVLGLIAVCAIRGDTTRRSSATIALTVVPHA